MEITDVKIRKINQEGKMRAIVSVTFDSAFVVHDIKVIEASGKLFVAMPSSAEKFSNFEYPTDSLEKSEANLFRISENR